jgi:hypothetical protein
MKIHVKAKDRAEARAIEDGLTDDSIRAFVAVCGYLQALPTLRARTRVLTYAIDALNDPDWQRTHAPRVEPTPDVQTVIDKTTIQGNGEPVGVPRD